MGGTKGGFMFDSIINLVSTIKDIKYKNWSI